MQHFFTNKLNLLFLALVLIFVFFRVYKIQDSMLFYNDMGRDMLVLHDWLHTGKPPLLGPQTSSLPFNQSALYFYLLMPAFVISGESVYSPIFTLIVFYLAVFAICWYLARKSPTLQKIILLCVAVFAIHPQFILQNRMVWNPSFVSPLVLLGFILFTLFGKNRQTKFLLASAAVLTLSASFSYSILPVAAAFTILAFFLYKRTGFTFLLAEIISAGVWNVMTVVFELRHNFLLTQAMIYRRPTEYVGAALSDKLFNAQAYVFNFQNQGFGVIFSIILLFALWKMLQKKTKDIDNQSLTHTTILLALTFLITMVMPVPLHSHYIFGLLTLLAILIGHLPFKLSGVLLAVAVVSWLAPAQIQSYFATPYRTVTQTEQCAVKICSEVKDPVFVSLQAGGHPFHNGPEFRFLMKRAGCTVEAVEETPDAAQKMVVINDNSEYTHGKTAFNELTLFGNSIDTQTISCQENLSAHVLQRL